MISDLLESVDWNDLWKELRARRTIVQKSASGWDKRSSQSKRAIPEDCYVQDFLGIMKPQPDWTVLDMGCGSGILAPPFRLGQTDHSRRLLARCAGCPR